MPYVNIKITEGKVKNTEKDLLIKGVAELLQRVLNKNPSTTVVIIDEISIDNWGINGQSVSTIRQQ